MVVLRADLEALAGAIGADVKALLAALGGKRNVTQAGVVKTTDYTFVLADNARPVDLSGSTGRTFTVPPGVFAEGDVIEGCQTGTGQITIAGGVGVTFKGALTKTADEGSVYGLRCLGGNVFARYGRLVT